MKNKDPNSHLHLMMDSFRKAKKYLGDMSYEDFLQDEKTQSAVIMQLHVIGELSKNILENTKKEIDIPWRDIAGMRDIIAHDYFGMDLKVVWDTAKQSVPEAEVAIDKYLKSIGE